MSATGSETSGHVVIVVGAGPAGMALAKRMADAGHEVIILNRDIKFGGLAEYGIFPSKLKLRGGLKKQYWDMLEQPNVHYFGNVSVGEGKDLTVEELRGLGASAIAFSIGAQGTKAIGVEGDSAKGVFHAKDVVYHFNRLPGFGDRPFDMGKHVAIIGVGDVMVDIAHWLIRYKRVERVTAIARRGPAERKYNPKEIRAVCAHMDREGIAQEFARIKDRLAAVGQNADEVLTGMTAEFTKCEQTGSHSKMGFRFLASPKRVLVDANHRVRALEMEDNKLEPKVTTRPQSGSSSITNSRLIASCLLSATGSMKPSGSPIRTACMLPIPARQETIPTTRSFKPMMRNPGRSSMACFWRAGRVKPAKDSWVSPNETGTGAPKSSVATWQPRLPGHA